MIIKTDEEYKAVKLEIAAYHAKIFMLQKKLEQYEKLVETFDRLNNAQGVYDVETPVAGSLDPVPCGTPDYIAPSSDDDDFSWVGKY